MVDPLADLRSDTGSLISVYVNRPSPGGFAALLSDLLKPARDRAAEAGNSVAKALRADLDRIRGLAPALELEPVPSYAIFASDLDGHFLVKALGHEVQDRCVVAPTPYLRPLRSAPRPMRSGVLVADRLAARVFHCFGGQVDQLGEPLTSSMVKANYGGFSGYEEQTARRRSLEMTHRMWKEAGRLLLDLHTEHPLDYLVVGGREEILEELAGTLHPYLARLHRVTFAASPGSISTQVVRAEVAGFDDEVRRERHTALAGVVCDTAWSGGHAVLGLTSALQAANAQAIDTLLVAGEFARPGTICRQCSHLAREGEECPVCGARTFGIDDVVAALIETTVSSGGKAHQIVVASPLDSHGVGALTRFPVPV